MYEKRLRELIEQGIEVKVLLACIYDLFQNYEIDESEENVLYGIADPNEEFNNVSDYWRDYEGENLLLKGGTE